MNAPELRLMTPNFELLGVIDNYESMQWTRKLYEIGDVEIHINLYKNSAALLTPGMIVFMDEARAGIIENVSIEEAKAGVTVVAKGKQLKALVSRRITVPDAKAEDQFFGYDRFPDATAQEADAPAESVIKHYAAAHLVNPEDKNRCVPQLLLSEDQSRGMDMRWQSRFEALSDVFKGIGEYSGMGYDITLDLAEKKFIFDVICGQNKTSISEHTNPIIFSSVFGNISSSNYIEDTANWVNTAYAGGAGEDEERLIHTVFEAQPTAGIERRETFLDCGSIDNIEDLKYEASYRMSSRTINKTINGVIAQSGPFAYMQDWDLGDVVTIQNSALGIETDERITEVKESYEQNKFSVQPTFGARQKNLLDEIRTVQAVR